MEESTQELLNKISELRDKLNKTADMYGLKSKHTIKVSQSLDKLINQYYQPKIE